MAVLFCVDTKNHYWHVDVGYSSIFQIPHELLKIAYTTTHVVHEGFDGDDFDARVDEGQIF